MFFNSPTFLDSVIPIPWYNFSNLSIFLKPLPASVYKSKDHKELPKTLFFKNPFAQYLGENSYLTQTHTTRYGILTIIC